jgi:ADP-dependent NAD(P)H-hydrate dehydratase
MDGELAAAAARRHRAAVTISGHVASPDGRRWRAETAVPGLGTAGSGDVRSGLVAGAAARCSDAAQAACWGTYLHVAAGARLAERIGAVGYLARELLDEVPRVMEQAMPPA